MCDSSPRSVGLDGPNASIAGAYARAARAAEVGFWGRLGTRQRDRDPRIRPLTSQAPARAARPRRAGPPGQAGRPGPRRRPPRRRARRRGPTPGANAAARGPAPPRARRSRAAPASRGPGRLVIRPRSAARSHGGGPQAHRPSSLVAGQPQDVGARVSDTAPRGATMPTTSGRRSPGTGPPAAGPAPAKGCEEAQADQGTGGSPGVAPSSPACSGGQQPAGLDRGRRPPDGRGDPTPYART